MALTLQNTASADVGGLQEIPGIQGSPTASTAISIDGSHVYQLNPGATVEQLRFSREDGNPYDNDIILGFKVEITDATPGAVRALVGFFGTTGNHCTIALSTSGKILIIDETSTARAVGSTTILDNTTFRIEVRFRRGTTGTGEVSVFIDSVAEISDLSAGDYQQVSENLEQILLLGLAAGEGTVYYDSIYIFDGGSADSDMLKAWKTAKFNKTDGGASELGDTLDNGTWADASETPVSGANFAEYTASGVSGGMQTDSGSFPGPNGRSEVDGPIVGATYVFVGQKGTGAGVPDFRVGNSGDGMTAAGFTLTTSIATHRFISESATIVPTVDESFQLGALTTDTANSLIVDCWAIALIDTTPAGDGDQALPNFSQAGVGVMQPSATGAQTLANPAQSGAGVQIFTATGAQLFANSSQAGVGVQIFTATGAQLLAALAQAGVGVMQPLGTGAQLLENMVQAGVGVQIFTATGAQLLAALAQAGVGRAEAEGAGAQLLANLAQVGTGVHTIVVTSTGVQLLASLAQVGVGRVEAEGAGAQFLANPSQSGVGVQIFTATGAQLFANPAQVGIGVMQPDGAGAQALANLLQVGVGVQKFLATGAQLLASPLQVGVGVESFSATSVQTLAAMLQAGVGVMLPSGAGAQLLAALAQTGVGVQTISGTGVQILAILTQVGSGIMIIPGPPHVVQFIPILAAVDVAVLDLAGINVPGLSGVIVKLGNDVGV